MRIFTDKFDLSGSFILVLLFVLGIAVTSSSIMNNRSFMIGDFSKKNFYQEFNASVEIPKEWKSFAIGGSTPHSSSRFLSIEVEAKKGEYSFGGKCPNESKGLFDYQSIVYSDGKWFVLKSMMPALSKSKAMEKVILPCVDAYQKSSPITNSVSWEK